ncbi:MAG TPA: hypothetical protein VFN13_10535 [Rudaea sp.]|nr:hypothetical protein [Rudaea sp.]
MPRERATSPIMTRFNRVKEPIVLSGKWIIHRDGIGGNLARTVHAARQRVAGH